MQLDEMAVCVGGAFTVVEQGAGKGALAYDVLSALGRGRRLPAGCPM
jgi:SAM-dependent MidA family methyltransferase